MSVGIRIHDAIKRYGDVTIIDGLSIEVKAGEFFTLLGPSGCGKTTLLRMVAGFNTIEGGDFYFGDRRINDLDPAKRNIGMVFQNYAIFPHLTVEKNVAFGLKSKGLPKGNIKIETDKFLDLMQIKAYAGRLPERLSGGQQQRVALARALVINPDVLLMDEPLSNLDAKLRVEMRQVIKDIQSSVGITTFYVTHDQEEAMAVSDRIAIMNLGEIQHIGTPKDVYQRPANLFVASFIGQTNIIEAQLKVEDTGAFLVFENGYSLELHNIRQDYHYEQKVIVSIRPEEFIISSEATGLEALIENHSFLGLNTVYNVKAFKNKSIQIIQESTIKDIINPNQRVNLKINAEKINVFVEDGSINILEGVNNDKKENLYV